MKLTKLAAKPQLVKIELSDEEIIKEYGEALEFWIWDRQPMENYVKLAQINTGNLGDLIATVNTMVLDENGQPVCNEETVLPTSVLTKVIGKVVETLGK